MNPSSKRWILLLIVSLCSLSVQAQDQAERLFDNATTFMSAGKYKEAMADLQSLISSFPRTSWASKALLTMARYHLETEGDFEKALELFSRIQTEYASEDEASAAYYYKALIMERRGESVAELESAVADLMRMRNLYPENSSQAGALFLFGKLSLRLKNYLDALKHFQDLEFTYSQSPFLSQAFLHAAQAAYLKNQPDRASMILARLQTRYPNSPESERARSYLRLIDRIRNPAEYKLDSSFFGSTPKSFSSPTRVAVGANGEVAIRGQKSIHFASIHNPTERSSAVMKDLEDFGYDREGNLLLIFKNRIMARQSEAPPMSQAFRDIRSASVDAFGRLFVVDDDEKDAFVFSKDGSLIRHMGLNRPRMVRAFGGDSVFLLGDGSRLQRFDASFNPVENNLPAFTNIVDFCFDPYGNLYVLSGKGATVTVLDHTGAKQTSFNLKNGYPLKQAHGIAADASGAIYLADRRGGAVQRFQ